MSNIQPNTPPRCGHLSIGEGTKGSIYPRQEGYFLARIVEEDNEKPCWAILAYHPSRSPWWHLEDREKFLKFLREEEVLEWWALPNASEGWELHWGRVEKERAGRHNPAVDVEPDASEASQDELVCHIPVSLLGFTNP